MSPERSTHQRMSRNNCVQVLTLLLSGRSRVDPLLGGLLLLLLLDLLLLLGASVLRGGSGLLSGSLGELLETLSLLLRWVASALPLSLSQWRSSDLTSLLRGLLSLGRSSTSGGALGGGSSGRSRGGRGSLSRLSSLLGGHGGRGLEKSNLRSVRVQAMR